MSTDWKALCAELADMLEANVQLPAELETESLTLLGRARAALAGPVGDQAMPPRVGHVLRLAEIIREVDGNHDKGAAALAEAILSHPDIRSAGLASVVGEPSDEELLDIAAQSIEPYDKIRPGEYEPENNCAIEVYSSELIAFARAVLARYGHRPAPLPSGEVGELVAWLRETGDLIQPNHLAEHQRYKRAADLLEQRHPTPVPVASDTYFEFVIFDADDCTQAGGIAPTYAQALSEGQHYLAQYQQDGPHTLELRRVEVLPPGAFPVPDDAPVPLPDDAQVIEPATHTILVPVPAPVPVAERLPGPEDCDAEGNIWAWRRFDPEGDMDNGDFWCLAFCEWLEDEDCGFTHWLPVNALPLPEGEVQP